MPQKPVYCKAPILTVQNCFPASGTIRSDDGRIGRLYQNACRMMEQPCLWEGLFRLACLIRSNPLEEPVAKLILDEIINKENGIIEGTITDQICKARAALAVYEYNTDRSILKSIALWLRYLEIEFDTLCLQDHLLFQPADLMELLVRFYQSTGTKAVLRICSKLRAKAFDWTTALQTFQQSIPIKTSVSSPEQFLRTALPEELDFDDRQKLINHSELLADGVRYTLFAGLYSGHGMDLSSGKTVWKYLARHHYAICGGTTSDPFLCGCGADKPISNTALAAWTEAFAAQMILSDPEWATDELIRIVFNGLYDCLEKNEIKNYQYVNTTNAQTEPVSDPAFLYARITRAAATAYRNAITLTEDGKIRINYLLPARYLLMISKHPFILQTDDHSAVFHCKNPFHASVDFYLSKNCTDSILIKKDEETICRQRKKSDSHNGLYLHSEHEWKDGDCFIKETEKNISVEQTHHNGVCFIMNDRLLSVSANTYHYDFAFSDMPEIHEDKISVILQRTGIWHIRNGIPYDIPVLPRPEGKGIKKELKPYYKTECRITMFPRTGAACLK